MFSKPLRSTVWVIAVGTFLLSALSASAATYYVATNGNDSNPGTIAQPFRAIGRGISALSGGDTLRIRGGTYNERLSVEFGTTFPSGSPGSPTIIEGYESEKPVIQMTSRASGGAVDIGNASWLVLRKLVIDAGYTIVGNDAEDTPLNAGGSNNLFEDLELRHSINYGFIDGGTDNRYNRLWVHDLDCIEWTHTGCQTNNAAGGYLQGTRVIVENSVFENIDGVGMTIRHGSVKSTVRNNISRYNQAAGFGASGVNDVYVDLFNNIIYENRGGGINLFASVQTARIYNNTIYNNSGEGINNGSCGTNAPVTLDARNNILYGNGGGAICGPIAAQSNNLTANPLFINSSAGDFHLQSTSLARDAGTSLPEVAYDFEGNVRPHGGSYDIGAYEYKDSVLPVPANLRIVKK